MTRTRALMLFAIFLLGACDPSSVTDDVAVDSRAPLVGHDEAAAGLQLIRGHGSKGPLLGATVQLFTLDSAGYPAVVVADTVTDANGNWTLSVDGSRDYLVAISGGRYVDESDPNIGNRRVIELADTDQLLSILPAGESVVAVTVLSHALVEKSRRETAGDNFLPVFANNRELFAAAFGFDVVSVLPANPLAPAGSRAQLAYAQVVGGIANAINSLAIALLEAQADFTHIDSISRDLVDCRLDGVGTGGAMVVPGNVIQADRASVNAQILRFRNNNFARYLGQPLVVIDDYLCAGIGGTSDTVAPVITQIPLLPTLDAQTAAGTAVEQALRDEALRSFTATDDRRGTLHWELGLPTQLVLGVNELVATVTDEWGNVALTSWQITVADLSAPFIGPVETIVVAAQGDRTMVTLAPPTVMDNVSVTNRITLSNDVPTLGFPVGQTVVTWRATDEAGLVSTRPQTVQVDSLSPVVSAVPASLVYEATGVDFSVFFTDPDATTLTFSIAGLPEGTGLNFATGSGVLDGVPSAADLAQQPLNITVIAFDGQNSVALQTTLELAATNTPPVFVLTPSAVNVNEDFGEVTVAVLAAPVPVTELGQIVTYTVETLSSGPPLVDYTLDAATGQLTLNSLADAYGTYALRVTADDGQSIDSSYSRDLTITVASVNDAPQVTTIPTLPEFFTGSPVSVDLAMAFSDIDDTELEFIAAQLPASLGLSVAGVLAGTPQPVDAIPGGIPIRIVAADSSGAAALLELTIIVRDPDSDGDGVSDFSEAASGLDPFSNDSDGDGFIDSLEALVDIGASDVTLYVRPGGDDTASGSTPELAVASLTALTARLAAVEDSRRVVALVQASPEPYLGNLTISGGIASRIVVGSVTIDEDGIGLDSATVPHSTLTSISRRTVELQNCQDCQLHHLRLSDSPGALSVLNSSLLLSHVHVVNQYTVDNGAAVLVSGGAVDIVRSHLAANATLANGGAIHAQGEAPQLLIRDTIITGNYAAGQGAALVLSGGTADVSNTLITGNGATNAPVVVARRDAAVSIAGSTLAYNFIGSSVSTSLFARDRGSRLAVNDNVVINNRGSSSQDAGMTVGASGGGYNLVSAGQGIYPGDLETTTEADFIGSYALGGSLSAGIDSGSASAVLLGLDSIFSLWNWPYPDAGQADRGYHPDAPALPPVGYTVEAVFRNAFGYRHGDYEVDLIIRQGGELLGAGHRVRAASLAAVASAQVIGPSLVTLAGTDTTRLAIDLGDGRYRVWLGGDYDPAQDALLVQVDDDEIGRVVAPVCSTVPCAVPGRRDRR